MVTFTCLPENRSVPIAPQETVLDALLKEGIAHTNICGGRAYCSTCRIMILEGADQCSPPTEAEKALAKRLDLPFHVRLACQTKLSGYATLRRLVLDSGDLDIVDQQLSAEAINQERPVALLAANIRGAVDFDEVNFAYDIVYLMGRYFSRMQKCAARFGGVIPNVMGKKLLAVFGLKNAGLSPAEQAVWAALAMLESVAELNDFLAQMRYQPLTVSIGVHYGSTVLAPLPAGQSTLLTPLGETAVGVNRLEFKNQELGSQLLVSEAVYQQLKGRARVGRRVSLQESLPLLDAYEILGMDGEAPQIASLETEGKGQRALSFLKKFGFSWGKRR
ncbi:MAG: 2Fe-2S iron-sulfur cluster-binding protein [Cyanobacteriota bacterium]|jgi:adenylate cyclase